MKVIYNNILPFKGFVAMTLYPFIFVRKEYADIFTEADERHERIHTMQMLECGIIGFYLWYVIEWLIRVLVSKDAFSHQAYRNISFEKEAYKYMSKADYIENRKHYVWLLNMFNNNN